MWLREAEALTPCLISLVQSPDGSPATLHRLFLTLDGQKAPVENPKRLLSKAGSGFAIRLFDVPDSPVLNVCEGVETGLAVAMASTGESVWAGVSAGGLASMAIPEGFARVNIWADHDKAGLDAAELLAGRYPDRELKVYVPEKPGADWLDVFCEESL
jgi:putative DNA primase/helicase